jgi:hypothetical protein
MTDHNTTEKKTKFVEAFAEAIEHGVPEKEALELARLEAGYSDNTRLSIILKGLGDEFIQYGDIKLKLTIPKAIKAIKDVLEEPDNRGASNALAAAASVLDRAGVLKKEHKEVNITMPSGIAFMPPKIAVDLTQEADNGSTS